MIVKGLKVIMKEGKAKTSIRSRIRLKKNEPTGVVYISHIPHGFYEEQIEAYFGQFGKVTAVSVPRSKTRRSRGYAFVEFKHHEVAKIAAETMNNYLMCGRLLKAKCIAPEHQKPHLFSMSKASQTATNRAEMTTNHVRKLKNRHLKLGLEVRSALKLLKRAKILKRRAMELGIGQNFTSGETSLMTILKNHNERNKKGKSKSL